MDTGKDQDRAVWTNSYQKHQAGVPIDIYKETEAAESCPGAKEVDEVEASISYNVRRLAGTARELALVTIRRVMASTDITILAIDYITIYLFLGIALMFVVTFMERNPSGLYPYIILVFMYLVCVWLPLYMCMPEMLMSSMQEEEGQCKEKSVEENYPVVVVEPRVILKEVGTTKMNIMTRNKGKFAFAGALLMFAGCLGLVFPLTVAGGFFMVIPFYCWMTERNPEPHKEMLKKDQVPIPSSEEVKPSEHKSLNPPQLHITHSAACEDVLPYGEDRQSPVEVKPSEHKSLTPPQLHITHSAACEEILPCGEDIEESNRSVTEQSCVSPKSYLPRTSAQCQTYRQ